jgi:hypothetical protein
MPRLETNPLSFPGFEDRPPNSVHDALCEAGNGPAVDDFCLRHGGRSSALKPRVPEAPELFYDFSITSTKARRVSEKDPKSQRCTRVSYALSTWNRASNARPAGNGTQPLWTNPPAAARVMSKIARCAASRMCFVSSTTPRRKNSLLPQSWSDVVRAHALILIRADIDRRHAIAITVDDTRISRQVGVAVEDKRGYVVVSGVGHRRSRLETEVHCVDKQRIC